MQNFRDSHVALTVVLLGVCAAVLMRYWLYYPSDSAGDVKRYLAQAEAIWNGEPFGRNGHAETHLPPVYPLFIAATWTIHKSTAAVRVAQLVLSILSCIIVYDALRLYSRKLGVAGLFLMALNPYLAHRAGHLLSETLSVFLMSVFIWLLARFARKTPSNWTAAAASAMGSILVLTAPATVFIAATATTYLAVASWRRWGTMLAILVGALVPMIPWQIHCFRHVGHVVPTVYTIEDFTNIKGGFGQWVKTWQLTEYELRVHHFYLDMKLFDRAPDRAFSSCEERVRLRELCEALNNHRIERAEFDAEFAAVASVRRQAHPWQYYIGLPLARSVAVWGEMEVKRNKAWSSVPGGPFDWDYVWRLHLEEPTKSFLSKFLLIMHVATLGCFAFACFCTLRSRSLLAWAILLGVAGYTISGAIAANHEVRRNVVFYPALIALIGISTRRNSKADDEKLNSREVNEAASMTEPVSLEAVSRLSPDTLRPVAKSDKPATECPATVQRQTMTAARFVQRLRQSAIECLCGCTGACSLSGVTQRHLTIEPTPTPGISY